MVVKTNKAGAGALPGGEVSDVVAAAPALLHPMQVMHAEVRGEAPAKVRGERERQLRRYGARDLTVLYNQKTDSNQGANLTQRMKIAAILDLEFPVAKVGRRQRQVADDVNFTGGVEV